MSDLGRVLPPFGGLTDCANVDCDHKLAEAEGAYMFKDVESGKLCIFCDDCARYVELNASQQFKLVAL